MNKKYKLGPGEIVRIIDFPGFCFATDDITVNGNPVGYMYREEPEKPEDSGWRFFSGFETDDEANDPSKIGLFTLNTIANYDRSVVSLLHSDFGKAFARDKTGNFAEEPFSPAE